MSKAAAGNHHLVNAEHQSVVSKSLHVVCTALWEKTVAKEHVNILSSFGIYVCKTCLCLCVCACARSDDALQAILDGGIVWASNDELGWVKAKVLDGKSDAVRGRNKLTSVTPCMSCKFSCSVASMYGIDFSSHSYCSWVHGRLLGRGFRVCGQIMFSKKWNNVLKTH